MHRCWAQAKQDETNVAGRSLSILAPPRHHLLGAVQRFASRSILDDAAAEAIVSRFGGPLWTILPWRLCGDWTPWYARQRFPHP